jgi:predicted LPLAT superfamily acyltransferase
MSWSAQQERGGALATGAAVWLALHGGRIVGTPLVWAGAAWFMLTSGAARRASVDYVRRVLGRPARLTDVARHFHSFGVAVLDRVLLLGGRHDRFEIETHGLDQMRALLAAGRGCILLGAHLGSFEVLRAVGRDSPMPVWALMHRRNHGALTRLLDRLAPDVRQRVLEIGDTASMIRARECVERGEIVGILADRAPPGQRMVSVPFLGQPALFPSGPFVLAGMLGAPVVLFHAVRTGHRRYSVTFSPFMDRVMLRRASRAADLHDVVARYAVALGEACRAHPYQWFNFFPFWETTHDADPDAAATGADPAIMPGDRIPAERQGGGRRADARHADGPDGGGAGTP